MPIFSKLLIGDVLQFPSGALRKLTKIYSDELVFSTLKGGKKRLKFTIGFVLRSCDLMPQNIDTQLYLNTTHLRKAINITSQSTSAYSDLNVLKGYVIEDEMIDPPPVEEED